MMRPRVLCPALGCLEEGSKSQPFCIKHWFLLSFKAQRAIRNAEPECVRHAVDELAGVKVTNAPQT